MFAHAVEAVAGVLTASAAGRVFGQAGAEGRREGHFWRSDAARGSSAHFGHLIYWCVN